MNLVITQEAEQDIDEIYQWYELQKETLGNDFFFYLNTKINLIATSPFIFRSFYENVQVAKLNKFPYLIYYLVEQDDIIILAILHSKRDSEYIYKRINIS
jgi:toxin ParE1/3/4